MSEVLFEYIAIWYYDVIFKLIMDKYWVPDNVVFLYGAYLIFASENNINCDFTTTLPEVPLIPGVRK